MSPGRWTGTIVAALALGGCVHYAPRPAHPEQFAAAFDARRLEPKPAGAEWSGAELLQAAIVQNPQIAEARARYMAAVAAARTARLTPGLTLTLTAEYADETPRWGYGGAADIPLDLGARRGDRITAADLKALQAWYDYGEAVWTVRAAIQKARIDGPAADEQAKLAAQIANLRRDRVQRLERRVAAGEDPRAVALVAQNELALAEQKSLEASGRREQAVVALAKALGVEPFVARDVHMAAPVDPEVSRVTADSIDAWRREATLYRSDVLRAIADYDLAESALRLEVAKQYPEVRIGPGYTYDHGVNKLPFNLSLALPTYDLNRRAIDQAEATRAAAGRSLELAQANALAAVDAAMRARDTARADLQRVTGHEIPAARRMAANGARAVSAGESDRATDLATQAAALDAELNLHVARQALQTSLADLEGSLRRSFDPAEDAALRAAMARPGATK